MFAFELPIRPQFSRPIFPLWGWTATWTHTWRYSFFCDVACEKHSPESSWLRGRSERGERSTPPDLPQVGLSLLDGPDKHQDGEPLPLWVGDPGGSQAYLARFRHLRARLEPVHWAQAPPPPPGRAEEGAVGTSHLLTLVQSI
ncbi:hypothetical protein PGTUg99_001678 [Puccinia graminis f. sp. tritici]|uniref:Uncharacterized protein n=1 Tax=Puccinia graminis f. sp. tritici TaxID=56615 RepID=A0A5B0NNH3_PUCGR|nr:hypothetical protein PGTUg99_001678 [Puccinia graminis f. sp. tritici]